MKRVLSIALFGLSMCAAAQGLVAAEHANEADESAKVLAEQVCAVCHGPGGHSTFLTAPSLAAQPRAYLVAKMKLLRNRMLSKPENHIDVLGLALLDDPTTEALARYFANQPAPVPVAGDAAMIAAGGKIFGRGVQEQGIAACSVCHGANAAGFWIFPRLAGQHAEYMERALEQIQLHLRDAPIMHGIIKNMTADEIKAVALFVQSK